MSLGNIISIEASEHIMPWHGGFFMRNWRRKEKFSGGFMLEKCCHDIDFYNMIVGCRPKKVASFGGRRSFIPSIINLSKIPKSFQNIIYLVGRQKKKYLIVTLILLIIK